MIADELRIHIRSGPECYYLDSKGKHGEKCPTCGKPNTCSQGYAVIDEKGMAFIDLPTSGLGIRDYQRKKKTLEKLGYQITECDPSAEWANK